MYTTNSDVELKRCCRGISWSAIMAGVAVSFILAVLLNLLGLGLGFPAVTVDKGTMEALGIGSVIWLALTGIIGTLIAGWVAGRFASTYCSKEGAWYGFLAWGLSWLVMLALMASSIGAVIGGTASLVGKGLEATGKGVAAVGKGAAQVAPQAAQAAKNALPDLGPAVDKIKQQAEAVLNQAIGGDATSDQDSAAYEKAKADLGKLVTSWLSADTKDRNAAKAQIVKFLTTEANMSQEQAEKTVREWQQKYDSLKAQVNQKVEQAKQQATDAVEKTGDVLGGIALLVFFLSFLSAAAGAAGGALGVAAAKKKYCPQA